MTGVATEPDARNSGGARGFQPSGSLRLIAIAIAVAGLIDPAIPMFGASRARVAIVAQSSASGAAERLRARLVESLGSSYDIGPTITSDTAAAIVIGDRYPDDPVPGNVPVATVTVIERTSPIVRIERVAVPGDVPVGTVIRIEADVEAVGATGRTSELTVRVAGLEVGRALHQWKADRERWHAAIDAVPVGEPPYVLRIEASTAVASGSPVASQTPVASGFGRTAIDAVADVVVDVRRNPFRVQMYEPRPSWATTFIRRALEADARFQVAATSFSSRGIASRTREDVRLSDARLDNFDVVIVGGLDRLSAADVRSLDRYMRERGGAVVLVPDLRVDTGAARDLLPAGMTEQLLEQPAKLTLMGAASIEASELLVLTAASPRDEVVAIAPGSAGSPVIFSMPHGDGRLFVSGVMDAWRFRAAENSSFDRFWKSTVAGLALAVPPPIDVSVVPALLGPNQRGDVIVRVRSRAEVPVSATIGGDQPIRLSPAPEAGVFRGIFVASATPGRSRVTVETAGAQPHTASRTILVQPDAHPPPAAPIAALSMLASSHRGIDVTPDHLADLERFVRGAVATPFTTLVRHPMRSAWWMVPFAACLSGEWWLRRRRGLR